MRSSKCPHARKIKAENGVVISFKVESVAVAHRTAQCYLCSAFAPYIQVRMYQRHVENIHQGESCKDYCEEQKDDSAFRC